MSELSTARGTLLDHAKRMDPDGSIAAIAEVLDQSNPIIQDMPLKQGNLPTGMRSTRRAALPTVGWRRVNEGTLPKKSSTEQVQDQTAILEAWAEVDEKQANLNGNTAEWRMSEAKAFLEAMAQEFAETLFYGNSGTDEREFDGIALRYASPTGNQNVIDAGSSDTDNTSIYLVVWGDNIHGITPKGSPTGLTHRPYDLQVIENAGGVSGALMSGYRDQFVLEVGLHVRDPRYLVRIGSIEVSALQGGTPPDLTTFMTKALWRIPNAGQGRAVFYMNRTCGQYLDIQRQDKVGTGGQLSYDVVDGKWVPSFRGIPIHITDAIGDDETAV